MTSTVQVSPDGARYLAPSRPTPFRLRWLPPLVCRQSAPAWLACSTLSLFAWCSAVVVLCHQHGATWAVSLACGLMVAALPSTRRLAAWPVLVDQPALAFATWAAVAHDHVWLMVLLACLAASCRETTPVLAALFAWSLWPLAALLVVAAAYLLTTEGTDPMEGESGWCREHPILAGRKYHAGKWRDPLVMLTPWGGLLAAAFWPSWQLGAVLAFGYGQLLVASDSVRLYQQAAPVLAVTVAVHTPYALPLLLLTVFNPYAGIGV